MTLSEFKAWLDGFGESIGDAPTPEQWAKVREKLAQVQELYALPHTPGLPLVPGWTPPRATTCSGSLTSAVGTICRNQEPLGAEIAAAREASAHTLYEN